MGVTDTRGTVLVVDDDADIRDTIALILEDEGYRVACVANGAEALAHLEANMLPNLILLDLMMPVLAGVDVRSRQRKDPRLEPIPVVVISASGNLREKAASLAAAAMIQKPIALDTLLEAVERCSLPWAPATT